MPELSCMLFVQFTYYVLWPNNYAIRAWSK